MNSFSVIPSASPLPKPQLSFNGSVSANIGKRRAWAGPILSSPAREGHQSRMADIFCKARAQLDDLDTGEASTLPRRLHLSAQLLSAESGEVKYPALHSHMGPAGSLNVSATACETKPCQELVFPRLTITQDSGLGFSPQRGRQLSRDTDIHRTPPPRFCPPRPPRRDTPYSAETLKPDRYYASLGRPAEAPPSDTALSNCSSEHTSSTASWTGDLEFYYPKPQPVSQQQRQCSVSDWLERLPEKMEKLGEGNEDSDEDETPMSPLSPNVELERGTLRRRRIERQVRKRCVSYDDEDIFGDET
jgi:hypothetical protein